jgi:hypothetical protein
MKTVKTQFSDEFVAAAVEIARIFGEPAEFGDIVEKHVGTILENIATHHDQLVNTVEAWQRDNQLEAASVAERVLKKIDAPWRYTVQPSECEEGWFVVRFQA